MSREGAGVDIKSLSLDEIQALVSSLGEEPYRGVQLAEWVFRKDAADFEEMTDLSREFRARLREVASIGRLQVLDRRASQRDGTLKYLLGLADGETIETVLVPEGERRTVCVSTQIGCGMGCAFCATAIGGLVRNLTTGEIVDQVLAVRRNLGERPTNVVMMGMGEPLANYENVLRAVRLINHEHGLGIGIRRIAVSTCGLVPGIYRLSEENLQVVLAVSLHAAADGKRDQIMPINKKYPLAELIRACRDFTSRTGRRITFEYALMEDFNDSDEDARALATLLHPLLCHVNLIPMNPVPETAYRRPASKTVLRFQLELSRMGIEATARAEKGTDIEAACGQLRHRSRGVSGS